MSVRIEETLRSELLDRRSKLKGPAGDCCPPAEVTRLLEQVDAALARMDEIPRRPGKITFMERALILCLEGKRTTRDEALVRAFDDRAVQIQQAISDVLSGSRLG